MRVPDFPESLENAYTKLKVKKMFHNSYFLSLKTKYLEMVSNYFEGGYRYRK